MFKTSKHFLLICLAASAFTAPAYAENPAVVDVLLANIERQTHLKPTFESAEEDGDGNVTISKLSFAPASPEVTMNLTIDSIQLNDVGDEENGIIEVGSATFTGLKIDAKAADGQAFTVDMPEGNAESWFIKDAGDNPSPADLARASMSVAKKMSTGKITINAMGQSIVSDGYESNWDGDPATGAGKFSSKLASLTIPEALIALADPTQTLKNLGYGDVVIDFSGDGEYRNDNENMGFDMNLGLAAKDMAGLKISVSTDKIPLAALAELQNASSAGKEPDFSALMPQLQSVTVGGFSFRFEDASITKKLLPMIAAMSGMGDEKTLVANAGAMAQVGLMQLNNPEFAASVTAAINSFLNDPKSFTIALKPGAPVTVQQLMTLNPADPGAAIKMLGVTVTAND